jgi:hypothetical protein
MSPLCYPLEPEFGRHRTAERRVWEVLREQLPDEAALLYSVSMIEGAAEHEADLVVAWPGIGVAFVEVKGGHISRREGQWYQSSGGSTWPIKDPIVQAQDCKHVLHRLLVQRGSDAASARSAHLVAFPFTSVDPGFSYAGCPRGMILGRNDMASAASRVRTAIREHGAGRAPLTNAGLNSLLDVLEGQLPGQMSLLSWAEENEVYVDQLTRDQAKVARILREQRRLKVVGGAGTGKTYLALEQARRLAADGQRVALVCYSRGLARFLQRMTAEWPPNHRPAYVGLLHALPLHWGADPPPPEDDVAETTSYYEERLPAQMAELAVGLDPAQKFDAIVVDEAQDLGAAWWPPTLACLRDQENGGLYAFLDEAQRVFERHGEVPIPLPPIRLDENIRNTKQIAQVFGSLGAEQARYRGMDGPPVRFIQCTSDEAIHQADAQVERLLDEGWGPEQIALLVTGRRHQIQMEMRDYRGWVGYWDAFFAGDDVFYGHVLGFKGLERPVGVLAVNGLRDQARGREYLYVGLSRARSLLVVCGDLEQIAEMGGEGIRRRLKTSAVKADLGPVAMTLDGRCCRLQEQRGADKRERTGTHRPECCVPASAVGESIDHGRVVEFRKRDENYLAWVAVNPDGFVLNTGPQGGGNPRLHRATCATITTIAPFTSGSFIKVCSASASELDQWALSRRGAPPRRCGICLPPGKGQARETRSDVAGSKASPERSRVAESPRWRADGPRTGLSEVLLWTDRYIPFERLTPHELSARQDLRKRLRLLRAEAGEILEASYAGPKPANADVENLVLYNIDTAHGTFRSAARYGVRFEMAAEHRSGRVPSGSECCYRYRLISPVSELGSWYTLRRLAHFDDVELGRFRGPKQLEQTWLAIHCDQNVVTDGSVSADTPFAVMLALAHPRPAAHVAGPELVKALIDGTVAAFQGHDDQTSLSEISRRIAGNVNQPPSAVAAMLANRERAVLGRVDKLAFTRGSGVQWNPGDHACMAGQIISEPTDKDSWSLSGQVYELRAR